MHFSRKCTVSLSQAKVETPPPPQKQTKLTALHISTYMIVVLLAKTCSVQLLDFTFFLQLINLHPNIDSMHAIKSYCYPPPPVHA